VHLRQFCGECAMRLWHKNWAHTSCGHSH